MTVIQLSAGRKHTIKVGDKVQEVTLRAGEVRYLPFPRTVMDIPEVPKAVLPEKPTRLPYTPRVAPPIEPEPIWAPTTPEPPKVMGIGYQPVLPTAAPKITRYEDWSGARPTVPLDDVIELVKAYKGKKDIGFKPTLSNLIDALKRVRKKP
jgi:hypothetical protein